jgi:hypothetical protein
VSDKTSSLDGKTMESMAGRFKRLLVPFKTLIGGSGGISETELRAENIYGNAISSSALQIDVSSYSTRLLLPPPYLL